MNIQFCKETAQIKINVINVIFTYFSDVALDFLILSNLVSEHYLKHPYNLDVEQFGVAVFYFLRF